MNYIIIIIIIRLLGTRVTDRYVLTGQFDSNPERKKRRLKKKKKKKPGYVWTGPEGVLKTNHTCTVYRYKASFNLTSPNKNN